MNPSKGDEKLISFPTFRHILGIKNEKNLSKMKQYKRLVRFTVSPFHRFTVVQQVWKEIWFCY